MIRLVEQQEIVRKKLDGQCLSDNVFALFGILQLFR